MISSSMEQYLSKAMGLPFFCIVGDEDYIAILDELMQKGVKRIRISDFCQKDDKFPNIDELIDYFRTADVDFHDNKYVVVGLGEYLALRGSEIATKELNRLKSTTLGNARVIILLRGIAAQAIGIMTEDKKLTSQSRLHICDNTLSCISAINIKCTDTNAHSKGVKGLLSCLEDGASSSCEFNSMLSFDKSLIPLSTIGSSYQLICHSVKGFPLSERMGLPDQWADLLKNLKKHDYNLAKLFEKYGVASDFETDIYEKVSGLEFKNWLFFLSLKKTESSIQNNYLRFVVNQTQTWDDLKINILTFITHVNHTDLLFRKYYDERKKIVRFFPESDIAIFIKENSIDPLEEIYRYTDNTLIERKHIISWISKHGWNESISYVYPAITVYLKKYIFECGGISSLLTDYFEKYKIQKINNHLDDDFLKLVEDYGKSPLYPRLQTRDNAISKIENSETAFLYWIDALGVEYLSYFSELAHKKGLSIHIDVARADLPTITAKNKSFFEKWTGAGKYKEEHLDEIKHKESGEYYFTDCEEPIHLAEELSVIEKAVDFAATQLAMHSYKSVVIASDHGASRLAVLRKKEEKYSTDTKGEHSGRCCKKFDGCELEFMIEEDDYFVLTDYGRFNGSRAANVEVHGGASLEEVIVPIITLTLKKQSDTIIKVLNQEIVADRKTGTSLSLYISDVENTNAVSLVIAGVKYLAQSEDSSHYKVLLSDIRRSKSCEADVYDGDDLIGKITLNIRGKSGSINSGFDSEFDEF